jgi:hypothetical protein
MAIKKMTGAKKPVAKMSKSNGIAKRKSTAPAAVRSLKATSDQKNKALKKTRDNSQNKVEAKRIAPKATASAGKSNPQAANTKLRSRGSKTAEQMGDMNQREYYNLQNNQAKSGAKYKMHGTNKLTKNDLNQSNRAKGSSVANRSFTDQDGNVGFRGYSKSEVDALRNKQRAGGSKNLTNKEKASNANAKRYKDAVKVTSKPKAAPKSKPKASRGR